MEAISAGLNCMANLVVDMLRAEKMAAEEIIDRNVIQVLPPGWGSKPVATASEIGTKLLELYRSRDK